MAKMSENENCFHQLPMIMLALRTAVKEDLGLSASNIKYGQPLRFPNAFFPDEQMKYQENIYEYANKLEKYMQELQYIRPSWHGHDEKEQVDTMLLTFSYVNALELGIKRAKAIQRPVQSTGEK